MNYQETLEQGFKKAYRKAEKARETGIDPSREVEILPADDLAERVENLIGVKGLANRIRELENQGHSREEICLKVSDSMVEGEFPDLETPEEMVDAAVRSSVAILTEGVVAAPIEGIASVTVSEDDFIRISYSGPIRSAGGTAQVISVLVADYVRRKTQVGRYLPTEKEIERYVEEIPLYKKVANLQYTPTDNEIREIISNCPVMIDGEATENTEVSGQRNLRRINTNAIRGGMCLVVAEGIALKARKLKKLVKAINIEGWSWIDSLIKEESEDEDQTIKPNKKYLADLIAGRPVFGHPSRPGGFRLRLGRARNSGLATAGINPATMWITDSFLSVGTQLKIERPGKAAGVVAVDTIEGPTVRLKNGDVTRIDTEKKAKKLKNKIEAILDVGEILINYGDFLENNHPLIPTSYTEEWWIQEAKKQTEHPTVSTAKDAIKHTKKGIPLHPKYTYLWHDITPQQTHQLRQHIKKTKQTTNNHLAIDHNKQTKQTLETLLIHHKKRNNKILIEKDTAIALIYTLGLNKNKNKEIDPDQYEQTTKYLQDLSGLTIRKKAPTRIGCRMGRPEKSKERKMRPPTHLLFPVGEEGGSQRSMEKASENRKIKVELNQRKCKKCGETTYKPTCSCGGQTQIKHTCISCNQETPNGENCPKCGKRTKGYKQYEIDISKQYRESLKRVGERNNYKVLKGVKGLTSKDKTPEPIEKGILRAKHDLYVFKDGTIRYDLTDIPLTHFKPKEISTSIKKLKQLGYTKDINGDKLQNPNQILELKPQDVVLSKECCQYFLKTTQFIDDLLKKHYNQPPYYNINNLQDLMGTLLIGLAPHTSAGVLSRLIGYTTRAVNYAHPYFHAAKRRNCDGDEDCYMLLMDGLLNFSRHFLPDKTGGQMDAPLVLTSTLDPTEIDDEAHNLDIEWNYPLELYQATQQYKDPSEINIKTGENTLNTENDLKKFGYSHPINNINTGPKQSAYKTLGPMIDKMQSQLEIAGKIKAVDEKEVAEKVIQSHFLPDLIGNLRAFSTQTVRCVKCNTKYRRPPLSGTCNNCGNTLTLTVHENSVKKYLKISMEIAEEYQVSNYVKERLKLLETSINSLFENELFQQKDLTEYM
ncbi:Archaeal DNA polymerase II large subunit [Methanonatronarchaeum thermophilum]|uniref:DNA polymerase II large subunit n=1 Tax=Methanonatronarchaeum thermophilum TaxID=1927129 RepID=A0A1Y3G9L5_9EURY|nr:DNA polymerase II large subunit [Methanonatronarchaeum thermophilum]OUJ18131.1 Archaeal DNA polymerase II large subunit [Methanonatronarchaeum thermophilum]